MAFKPIDPKRDEFRRYLERSGVIEALTKAFVRLIKERPENPMNYLMQNLGDALLQADNVAYLNSELEEARAEIERLRNIIKSVNPEALIDPKEESSPVAITNETTEEVEDEAAADIPSNNETTDPPPSVKEEDIPTTSENALSESHENDTTEDGNTAASAPVDTTNAGNAN